jgi:hypothetical protein
VVKPHFMSYREYYFRKCSQVRVPCLPGLLVGFKSAWPSVVAAHLKCYYISCSGRLTLQEKLLDAEDMLHKELRERRQVDAERGSRYVGAYLAIEGDDRPEWSREVRATFNYQIGLQELEKPGARYYAIRTGETYEETCESLRIMAESIVLLADVAFLSNDREKPVWFDRGTDAADHARDVETVTAGLQVKRVDLRPRRVKEEGRGRKPRRFATDDELRAIVQTNAPAEDDQHSDASADRPGWAVIPEGAKPGSWWCRECWHCNAPNVVYCRGNDPWNWGRPDGQCRLPQVEVWGGYAVAPIDESTLSEEERAAIAARRAANRAKREEALALMHERIAAALRKEENGWRCTSFRCRKETGAIA